VENLSGLKVRYDCADGLCTWVNFTKRCFVMELFVGFCRKVFLGMIEVEVKWFDGVE
jgi:hypothetical protein